MGQGNSVNLSELAPLEVDGGQIKDMTKRLTSTRKAPASLKDQKTTSLKTTPPPKLKSSKPLTAFKHKEKELRGKQLSSNEWWKTDEARYLAYLGRAKIALVRAVKTNLRYAAYSSDLGEALRPVVPGSVVAGFYFISFAYVGGDVAYTGYIEKKERKSSDMMVARQVTETALFQIVASLAIPTAVIHTAVHQTHNLCKSLSKASPTLLRWGPSAVGMMCMPLLPLVDEPVERATETLFDSIWPAEKGWIRRHEEMHQEQKQKKE